MKKKFLFFSFFFGLYLIKAQSILNADSIEKYNLGLEESKKENIANFLPIEEKDIAFSLTTWEEIDLSQEINQIYYYESNEISNSCKSLYNALVEAIKNYQIEAYSEENFRQKLDLFSFNQKIAKEELSEEGKEIFNQGEIPSAEHYDRYEIKSSQIKKFKVKGIWYFDKKIGELKYKMLALAPIGPDIYQIGDNIKSNQEEVELFWIWYPEARKTLDQSKTCSQYGSTIKPSFEELLSSRKFSSLIYKEDKMNEKNLSKVSRNDMDSKRELSENRKEKMLQKVQQIWNP